MRTRGCWLSALALVVVLVATPLAPSAVAIPKVVVEVAKIVGPEIADKLLEKILEFSAENGASGKAIKIRPALGAGQLVLARQTFEIETHHWQMRLDGELRLISHVPCEALYSIDIEDIQYAYIPGQHLLRVVLPEVKVLKVCPDFAEQRKEIKTTRIRMKSAATLRKLEEEVPAAVKRLGAEEAEKHRAEVARLARLEMQVRLQDQLRKHDSQITVIVE
jgi:hypothetical protein